jgi:putative phage-type endonuclease
MPLTQDQLVARRNKVGSSDAAAILGVDPYRTPRDVWMDKTGKIEVAQLDNEAIRIGNEAEPMLLRMLAQDQKLDEGVLRTGVTFAALDGINASNPDGYIHNWPDDAPAKPIEIVEAKSTGLEGWGDDPAVVNDVPPKVLIQIHHQFYCTGALVCYVPVLIGRFGLKFRVYRVERDADLAKTIGENCLDWWAEHVVADVEPEGELHLDVAKRIKRTEGKSIPISSELVNEWQEARAIRLASEKTEKARLADLLAILGDAEVGEADIGKFTYRLQQRKGYVVKDSSYRVARFNKAK